MNPEFSAIERRVKAGSNPKDSAALLIHGIADRIDAALTSQSHLTALIQELHDSADTLANAVVVNTPADNPTPGTVSPDPKALRAGANRSSVAQNAATNPQSDVYQARQRLRERGVDVDSLSDADVQRQDAENLTPAQARKALRDRGVSAAEVSALDDDEVRRRLGQ